MTAPLTILRTFFVCAATTLLIACDSGGSSGSDIPEINSFFIYTADQTIYSFNETTGISTKRAEFDEGENQFIEIDTDESKPGFDYAVYVFKKGIYLLDYDKAKVGKITKLTQYAEEKKICNMIPFQTASSLGFKDGKHSNRSTLDLPALTIEIVMEGEDCELDLKSRDKLDFSKMIDENDFNNTVTKTSGNSDAVLGGLVIDYSTGSNFNNNADTPISETGSVGFLGFNLSGSLLTFNYRNEDEKDSWSKFLETKELPYPYSKQSSTDHVVVQNNQNVFVLNADPLFTINSKNSELPVQAAIDELFTSTLTLSDSGFIETNRSQNTSTFLVRQNNNLHYFEKGNFTPIPNFPIQSGEIIDFDLTSDNRAIVILENPDASQTLLVISTLSGEATSLLTADKIEIQVIENEFYVNTLEREAGSGWEALWFKSSTNWTSWNDSRFLFAKDMREMNNTLLILSTDTGIAEADIFNPAIYVFDKTRSNGRKRGADEDKAQVDFSYGRLNTTVSEIEDISIINDKYGKLVITGINGETGAGRVVREQYYFNPNITLSSQEPDIQSLRLMHREFL